MRRGSNAGIAGVVGSRSQAESASNRASPAQSAWLIIRLGMIRVRGAVKSLGQHRLLVLAAPVNGSALKAW